MRDGESELFGNGLDGGRLQRSTSAATAICLGYDQANLMTGVMEAAKRACRNRW